MEDWIPAGVVAAFLLFGLASWWRRPVPSRDGATIPPKRESNPRPDPKPEPKRESRKEKAAAKSAVKAEPKPAPTPVAPTDDPPRLPRYTEEEEDDDVVTLVTVTPGSEPAIPVAGASGDAKDSLLRSQSTVPILYDDDADVDEPTGPVALILICAAGQSDLGKRRQKNEDSYLALPEHSLFVVADGMGGYAGGDVASRLAVDTISTAFRTGTFIGNVNTSVPARGGELALAIKMANEAILKQAQSDPKLSEMGTTIVAGRFSPRKQRLYIGHVGDSRCYRLRGKDFKQMTTDHTMAEVLGTTGPMAGHLVRAVGIKQTVVVDLLIGKPRPNDIYLFCSDGLPKMVPDAQIHAIVASEPDLHVAVRKLIELANERGGKDNVTAILVRVEETPNYAMGDAGA